MWHASTIHKHIHRLEHTILWFIDCTLHVQCAYMYSWCTGVGVCGMWICVVLVCFIPLDLILLKRRYIVWKNYILVSYETKHKLNICWMWTTAQRTSQVHPMIRLFTRCSCWVLVSVCVCVFFFGVLYLHLHVMNICIVWSVSHCTCSNQQRTCTNSTK